MSAISLSGVVDETGRERWLFWLPYHSVSLVLSSLLIGELQDCFHTMEGSGRTNPYVNEKE